MENNVAQEQMDVEGYMKPAALVEKEGLVDLKMKMEEQAADKAGHAEVMRRMLG